MCFASNNVDEIKCLEDILSPHYVRVASNNVAEIKCLEDILSPHYVRPASNNVLEVKCLEDISVHTTCVLQAIT